MLESLTHCHVPFLLKRLEIPSPRSERSAGSLNFCHGAIAIDNLRLGISQVRNPMWKNNVFSLPSQRVVRKDPTSVTMERKKEIPKVFSQKVGL